MDGALLRCASVSVTVESCHQSLASSRSTHSWKSSTKSLPSMPTVRLPYMPLRVAALVLPPTLTLACSGIRFVEWNAGPQLDAHMTDAGFEVCITLDPATGVLSGGSIHNCGTWMDKMVRASAACMCVARASLLDCGSSQGESAEFGTKGVPATPRDGAPVEITAMVYNTVTYVVPARRWH